MTDDTVARIEQMKARNPRAFDLARLLSFAVLIEPALLRATRLELLPSADAGAEADLWFGPLVQSRSRDGIVLYPAVAELLRSGLQERQAKQCWRITERLHGYLPPAIRLEERLNWLSTRPDDHTGEMREMLQSALAALLAEKRSGIANWAGRALPRLSNAVRGLEEAEMLSAASDLRLGRSWTVSQHLHDGQIPDWFASVLPDDFPEAELGVSLTSLGFTFDPKPTPQSMRIRLPATDPRIVQLSSAGGSQIVSVDATTSVSIPFSFDGKPIELTTLAGLAYTVERDPSHVEPGPDGTFVCRAYANCNQALIVWQAARPIQSCLGFAIERTDEEGSTVFLSNYAGFSRSTAKAPQPSSEWPIQRFAWMDLSPPRGAHVTYTVTPVVGQADKLTLLSERAYRTAAVSIAAQEARPVSAFFNRDVGRPAASASPPRLGGEIRRKLLDLLAEAKITEQEIHAALWMLDDAELISAIAALGQRAHVLLAPGAVPNDSNARARSMLASSVDLINRRVSLQAHNSFLVVCEGRDHPTTVWTGSTSWTSGGLNAQDSNALLIRDPAIAGHYLDQWRRLRNDPTVSAMRQMNAQPASFTLADHSRATIWFSPVSNGVDLSDIRQRLAKARSGVLFAIGPRSQESVVDDLLRLRKQLYVAGVARTPEAGKQVMVYRNGVERKAGPQRVRNQTADSSEGERTPAQPPIGSRLIVIDPFDENSVVIGGSHFLSKKASQSNEENLVIIEGNTELAAQCAVHIRGLIDHYAFRASVGEIANGSISAKPAMLHEDDAWQRRFMTGDAAREIRFWMGRQRSYQPVLDDAELQQQPRPAPRGGKSKKAKKRSKPARAKAPPATKKAAKKTVKKKQAERKRTSRSSSMPSDPIQLPSRKKARSTSKKAKSSVKKTASKKRRIAKKK